MRLCPTPAFIMTSPGLPQNFPALPLTDNIRPWSANVQQAHVIMCNAYTTARQILLLDNSDPLRLRYHFDQIYTELVPLLDAVENNGSDTLPTAWLADAAEALARLCIWLESAMNNAEEQYVKIFVRFILITCCDYIEIIQISLVLKWSKQLILDGKDVPGR
jgi:hypothetical protein